MTSENKKMNSLTGKRILSLLRNGDYAHAGEEEAILRVFQNIPKDPNRQMLDVGCGIGGTVHFLNQNGWGSVIGLDIDPENIAFARNKYSRHEFVECDVVNAHQKINQTFNIIYCFNSFYAFPDKVTALQSLRRLAAEQTQLIIFDYLKPEEAQPMLLEQGIPPTTTLSDIRKACAVSGWQMNQEEDLNAEYERWYADLVQRIRAKKNQILTEFGSDWLDYVTLRYTQILAAIRAGQLGGVIITAFPQSISRS